MAHSRPQLPRIHLNLGAEYPRDPRVQQLQLQILNNPNYANNARATYSYLVFLTAQEMYEAYVRQARGARKKPSGPDKPQPSLNPSGGPKSVPDSGGGAGGIGSGGAGSGGSGAGGAGGNGAGSGGSGGSSGAGGSGGSGSSGAGSGGSGVGGSGGSGSSSGGGGSGSSGCPQPKNAPPAPQLPPDNGLSGVLDPAAAAAAAAAGLVPLPGDGGGQDLYLPLGPVNGLPQQLGTAGSDNSKPQPPSPGSQVPPTKPVLPRSKLGKGR
ncbi:orf65 [Alcelaphine gammaherpesvirus 2]|uniref:Small capsomere-interacting protein n=1 Tax=Alcelaphine gammaherpesvirus 2 TaxID=138184 RepID=A0A068ADH6_9GAMA|nr:orf65 [Alcelaphine gammaherpesvirus 2]AIA62102.1 orf65 [Alcelaphine gammaherpesvirus 2]